MRCSYCNQAFCWLCGKAVDDEPFPVHFQWWNPMGCSNMQLNESIVPTSRDLRYARLLTIFQYLFIGIPTFSSSFATLCLFCCCYKETWSCSMPILQRLSKLRDRFFALMTFYSLVWMGLFVFLPLILIGSCLFLAFLPFYLLIS